MAFKRHALPAFNRDNRHRMYDIKRNQDPELRAIKVFRGTGRWQRLRANFSAQHPTCADPFGTHQANNLPALGESVHHVIGLLECLRMGLLERLGLLPQNLRNLCTHCHNRVEGIYDSQGPEAAQRIFLDGDRRQEIISLVLD